MRILMKLMREWKFDNIIVCADSGGRNFRKEIYQEYKGKRKPVDNVRACNGHYSNWGRLGTHATYR
jgi:5'-3' exonuclease